MAQKAVRLVQTEALPEYQDIRDKMSLLFLPPYSPDLNPIRAGLENYAPGGHT